MIQEYITALVEYGVDTGLITEYDRIYTINSLLELFQLDEYQKPEEKSEADSKLKEPSLEEILNGMLDYAFEQGLLKENSNGYRDLFDTKIMGVFVPRPSELITKFKSLYQESPVKATEFYYKFSQDTDYIRRYRIIKDMKWVTKTEYGDLDITINLSKPEKDPKEIAAAKQMKQSGYPKCLLCKENEGYAGRINHPARNNHRILPIQIHNEKWGLQYSPYVYYNEHCIVLNYEHTPMKINKETFHKLFDFIKLFPHYFIGSNADLPIVGGSILTHDHFQGGNYEFAMTKAPIEQNFSIEGFEDVNAGIVKWPMSVIRLQSSSEESLIEAAAVILEKWRNYTDESANIYAYTDSEATGLTKEMVASLSREELAKQEPHNTITPIARKNKENYELDLVLRNNLTSKEHPLGLYHPHEELHHIKKENIGLIEVMGLAVLPARLKEEMELLKEYILEGKDIATNELIKKHKEWVDGFTNQYKVINADTIDGILKQEIGFVFLKVLEHAGVFKREKEGKEAFLRFIHHLDGEILPSE